MSASTKRRNRQAEIEAGTYKKQSAQRERDEKQAKEKRTIAICTAVVAVIVLAAILLNLIPALQRRAELRRYTDGVAVTIGDRNYSPAEVGYLYANQFNSYANSYYASIYGLNTDNGARGLGSQAYSGPEVEGESFATWRDYFLYAAYNQLTQIQSLLGYARDNNITLSDEEKDELNANIDTYKDYASMYGFTDVDQFLSVNFGKGVTLDMLRRLEEESTLANKAYTAYQDSLSFSDEELAEEYASFNGDYDSFSFASYLVAAKETEDESLADLAKADAAAEADAIIASYKDGADVEDLYDRFNGYIEEELMGEATRNDDLSGMYLNSVFADWMKDEARQAGDIEKFADGSDWYVVLFLDRRSASYPTANVRHILIKAEQDEDGTWTEEALAAARTEAERILTEWKESDMSEDSFAALAEQYSQDPGSSANGGLYENVYKGQMVKDFEDFCFAEERQPGDTGIVFGTNGSYSGYHVMYYVGEGRVYSDMLAENSLISKAMTEWMDSTTLTAVPGAEEALVDPVTEPVAAPAAEEAAQAPAAETAEEAPADETAEEAPADEQPVDEEKTEG